MGRGCAPVKPQGAPLVSDQPNLVRSSVGARPFARAPLRTRSVGAGGASDELLAQAAKAFLGPALGERDNEQACSFGQCDDSLAA